MWADDQKYFEFIAKIIGQAINKEVFKSKMDTKSYSEVVANSMESFLILCYTNGYDRWKYLF